MIIAEIGINHFGSFQAAVRTIESASVCGFDAVKFQIYRAEDIWDERPDIETRNRLQLTLDEYSRLADYAHELGLLAGASFFSYYGKDIVDHLDFIKIAARTIRVHEWIFSSEKRIIRTVNDPAMIDVNNPMELDFDYMLYGANDSVLSTIGRMSEALIYGKGKRITFGYSCHSSDPGGSRAIAAAAMGAGIIEKHFTLDKKYCYVDSDHSMIPENARELVRKIRDIWKVNNAKLCNMRS